MFKRFSIHVALIFLFAFAQIGAVTHEISHVEDLTKHSQQSQNNLDPSQQSQNNLDPSKQDQNTHNEQCPQCISFAKIAGGLVTQSFVFPTLQISFIVSAQLLAQPTPNYHTAYAARAPPQNS